MNAKPKLNTTSKKSRLLDLARAALSTKQISRSTEKNYILSIFAESRICWDPKT